MAMQGGTSRLAQMQMRFQQKQQQEREQKKLELSGPSKSNLESGDGRPTIGAGKVRQMFVERRQRSTGIDKSYPLKPIVGRTASGNSTPMKTTTTTTIRKQVGSVKQVNGKISSTRSQTAETIHITNGNGILTSEHTFSTNDNIDNESMPATPELFSNGFDDNYNLPELSKLSIQDSNKNDCTDGIGDTNNNSGNGNSDKSTNIKLNPVITKKTAPPMRSTASPVPPARLGTPRVPAKVQSPMNKPFGGLAVRAKASTRTPPSSASSGQSATSTKTESASQNAPRLPAGPIPENMAQCPICGRNFNNDRIAKHKEICQKTATKKRKIFDASKHRVKGTEIEQYVRKPSKGGARTPAAAVKTQKAAVAAATTDKKSNWRKKHEEFIQAIRAAKEMKAYLAKGGKLSDLPPPPPSENPDYVQCPHCQRRFNEGAASRHIPKCATMLHNKPKPGAKPTPKKR